MSTPDGMDSTALARDEIVAMLSERAPLYDGMSTASAEELRSRILAKLDVRSASDPVLLVVIEEMQTSANPRMVAAAARALRGLRPVPTDVVCALVTAIERIRHSDDTVDLAETGPTTAVSELVRTLTAFGRDAGDAREALRALLDRPAPIVPESLRADAVRVVAGADGRVGSDPAACCCGSRGTPPPRGSSARAMRIPRVALQDQTGAVTDSHTFFNGRPSVLAFFYTRCTNPTKCSLTITKLAALADRLQTRAWSVNIAAISYDPQFDTPDRLRAYGTERSLAFDARVRLFRTTGAIDELSVSLGLSVGYGATTVNQHGRDMFVFDAAMTLQGDHARMDWTPDDIVTELEALARSGTARNCRRS